MLRQTLLYLSRQPTLHTLASGSPAARQLAGRFMGGETLEEALDVTRRVNQDGMTVSLDHLGENVTTRVEAERDAADYVGALDAIAAAGVDANISLKLTSLGLDFDRGLTMQLMERVLSAAARTANFVRIDMEGSAYTQATVDIASDLFERHKNVGTVIQAYLYRSEGDVRALNALGMRVRLVKGAYLEPPAIAYPEKSDVDENFRRLADLLLHDGAYPAFATHDSVLIEWIIERARREAIDPARFEFQMIFGIRRDLQQEVMRRGHNVRVYIPYGTQWYPYFMRRLAERPANVLFIAGSLVSEARKRH